MSSRLGSFVALAAVNRTIATKNTRFGLFTCPLAYDVSLCSKAYSPVSSGHEFVRMLESN